MQWVPSGIKAGTKEGFSVSGTDYYAGTVSQTFSMTFGTINSGANLTSVKFTASSGSYPWPAGTYYWNFSSADKAMYWSTSDIVNSASDPVIIQTPVKQGASWTGPMVGGYPWTFEVTNMKQSVTVKAGSYSDVVVASATCPQHYLDTFTFYWSVKQGIIKITDAYTMSGTNYLITTELTQIQ
jgi:hypothetical protein